MINGKAQINNAMSALGKIISNQIGEDVEKFTMVYDRVNDKLEIHTNNKIIESENSILKSLIKQQGKPLEKHYKCKIRKFSIEKGLDTVKSTINVVRNNGRKEIIDVTDFE